MRLTVLKVHKISACSYCDVAIAHNEILTDQSTIWMPRSLHKLHQLVGSNPNLYHPEMDSPVEGLNPTL